MSEANAKIDRRHACERMFIELGSSISECARAFGVTEPTIYKWIKKGKWREKKTEALAEVSQINLNLGKALNQGLKAFAQDPTNKDLQSLVSMLKQFREQSKPPQEYKNYVLKIVDWTVDFFLEKGMDELADAYKKCVKDLANYLLNRQ